jgi:hypothetical protein
MSADVAVHRKQHIARAVKGKRTSNTDGFVSELGIDTAEGFALTV